MIINHNIPALNTYRSLTINQSNTSRSLAKLSSGLRINSAGDDAAGLAISEKMRSQIRGLNQAGRNAHDGKSLLNVAEGALNEVHSILQRMKELSVQSANDTNTRFDRGEIQKEVEQLKTEVDRISRDTEFNTMKLLNGTMENRATVKATGKADGTFNDKNFKLEIVGNAVEGGKYTLSFSGEARAKEAKIENAIGVENKDSFKSAITFLTGTTAADGSHGLGAKFGAYRLDISNNLGGTYDLTLTGPDGKYQTLQARDGQTAVTFAEIGVKIDFTNNKISGDGYVTFKNELNKYEVTLKGYDADDKVVTTVHQTIATYSGQNVNLGGVQFQITTGLATGSNAAEIDVIDNSIKLHIGANQGQNMNISILDSSAKALGVNLVDLTSQKSADTAISTIDNAINRVSSERSKMGAIINRLDHTIKNLGTTSENMQASESRIRDVDMAKEIMDFTKNNILSQASQSMLAQANALPQGVLGLLR
jgi:flagellin